MKISISVKVDRKSALLSGRVLGETATVDIGPEDCSRRVWEILVGSLDMTATPPSLGYVVSETVRLSDPTAVALVTEVERILTDADQRSSTARALGERLVAEYEADGIYRQSMSELGYTYERWSVGSRPSLYVGAIYPEDARMRMDARDAVTAPLRAEHNAPHEEQLRLLRAEHDDREAVRLTEEAEVIRETARSKYAARLESGYWERETSAYNERRCSSPWCARVSFPEGAKADYEFGESTGTWGKSGLMRVPCRPGDIIAWGQKDLRRPGNSDHTIAQMRPDGSMETIDNTEAFRRWNSRHAAAA